MILRLIMVFFMVVIFLTCGVPAYGADNDLNIGALIWRDTAFVVPNNTPIWVEFSDIIYDTDDMASIEDNCIYITEPGVYLVVANVYWRGTSAQVGRRVLALNKNGTTDIGYADDYLPVALQRMCQVICITAEFEEGDYLKTYVYQNSGAATALDTAQYYTPTLSVQRVGMGDNMNVTIDFPVILSSLLVCLFILLFLIFANIFYKKMWLDFPIFFLSLGVIYLYFISGYSGFAYFMVVFIFVAGYHLLMLSKMRR